jgi:hypothetical protein
LKRRKTFIVVGITSFHNKKLDYSRQNDFKPAPINDINPKDFYIGERGNVIIF